MAYITDNRYKQPGVQGQGGGMLEGGGAVAGTGAAANSIGTAQPSAAGGPSQWTNIQDFFGAQKGTPAMVDQIKKTGEKALGQAKTESQGLISQGQEQFGRMATPQMYSDKGLQNSSGEQVRGFLQQGQTQGPDYSQMDISQKTKDIFSQLDKGGTQNIIGFQNAMGDQPGAGYTGGMRRMDEALLGGLSPDFAANYGRELSGQYNAQIANPFVQQKQNLADQASARQTELGTAAQGWKTGLEGFLGAAPGKIDAAQTAQQKQYDDLQKKITADGSTYMPDWAKADYDQYGKQTDQYDQNYMSGLSKYTSVQGAPSRETAAYEAMGGDAGLAKYNELAAIYGQEGGANQYAPLFGSRYAGPSTQFDAAGFMSDLSRVRAGDAAAKDVSDRVAKQAADKAAADQAAAQQQAAARAANNQRAEIPSPVGSLAIPTVLPDYGPADNGYLNSFNQSFIPPQNYDGMDLPYMPGNLAIPLF